jgi:hypothetical protein
MLRLPRGVVLTVDPDAVVLSIGDLHVPPVSVEIEEPLPFGGRLGVWYVTIAPADGAGEGAVLVAPAGTVVRARRPGDRIQPRGMAGQKLQDYYVDRRWRGASRDAAPSSRAAATSCGRRSARRRTAEDEVSDRGTAGGMRRDRRRPFPTCGHAVSIMEDERKQRIL